MKKTIHPPLLCWLLLLLLPMFAIARSPEKKIIFFQQHDTATAAKEAAQVKTSLLKKIGNFFHFRRNARARERERVIQIIDSLGINDTILNSAASIRLLIEALSIKEHQHYDSLLAMIDSIKSKTLSVATGGNNGNSSNTSNGDNVVPVPAGQSKEITDKDIDDLANQLLPLIAEKTSGEKNTREQREALQVIRRNPADSNKIYIHTQGNMEQHYRLRLYPKLPVYAFYNAAMPYPYTQTDFHFIHTLVYDALLLDGTTGRLKALNGWDTAGIVSYAKATGSNVYFTLFNSNANITGFLQQPLLQRQLVDQLSLLLNTRKANGINLNFRNLPASASASFSAFAVMLYKALKILQPGFTVCLTLPPVNNGNAYDIAALKEAADLFFVDFTINASTTPGPLAPLDGTTALSLTASLSYYQNQGIPPGKLLLNLPYKGIQWSLDGKKNTLLGYPAFAEIKKQFPEIPVYDALQMAAYLDSSYGKVTSRIWFDDATTLAPKYDLALQSGLGGMAISYLGYDRPYGELWDLMLYKTTGIDTIYLNDSAMAIAPLSFGQRLYRRLMLYRYILANPCEVCFENASSSGNSWDSIPLYVHELRIDSVVNAYNQAAWAYNQDSTHTGKKQLLTDFDYINQELNLLLLYMLLIFFTCSLVTGYFYVSNLRNQGDSWARKKMVARLLIAFLTLFIVSGFAYVFTDDLIPAFGVSDDTRHKNEYIIKKKQEGEILKKRKDCHPDASCINMPFYTLLGIVLFGSVTGLLLSNYLIAPLLKKEDVP